MRKLLACLLALASPLAYAGPGAVAALGIHFNPPLKASGFRAWPELSEGQRRLLKMLNLQDDSAWQAWAAANDARAAAFLSITQALDRLHCKLGKGRERTGLELVSALRSVEGERLAVELAPEFAQWRANQAAYWIDRDGRKIESGKATFQEEDSFGGYLHPGYDVHGFTPVGRVPRFIWNLDGTRAEINLDNNVPRAYRWLPWTSSPTFEAADAKVWLREYVRKFGDPGFTVRYSPPAPAGNLPARLAEELGGAGPGVAAVRDALRTRQVVFAKGFLNEYVFGAYFKDNIASLREELGADRVTTVGLNSSVAIHLNAAELAAEVRALYQRNGNRPVVLVGHSMGGGQAVQMALRFPELLREGIVDRVVSLQGVVLGTTFAEMATGCGAPGAPHGSCVANEGLESMQPGPAQESVWRAMQGLTAADKALLDGKLYFVRNQVVSNHVMPVFLPAFRYMNAFGTLPDGFGGNDGQVPLVMQQLYGAGRALGALDYDHADLEVTEEPAALRRAFTRALFRELFE
jgi:pimeloyl-ACP methyl ester carboxylesterase